MAPPTRIDAADLPTEPGERWGFDVFLSYAHADVEAARRIRDLLAARGLRVWFDENERDPGSRLRTRLIEGIGGARWFLAVVTSAYAGRPWVENELGAALVSVPKGHILPLLDKGATLPLCLQGDWPEPIDIGSGEAFWGEAIEIVEAKVRGWPADPIRERWKDLREGRTGAVHTAHKELLAAYLRKLATREYRVFANQPLKSGEQVYVEVATRAAPDPEPEGRCLEPGSQHRVEDLVSADPTGRWAIQGDPGSGKTTLLRYLAARRAREAGEWLVKHGTLDRAHVPILVGLPLMEDGAEPWRIAAREVAPLIWKDAEKLAEALQWAVENGHALLLLDGWDEVRPGSPADAVQERVTGCASYHDRCAYVLTSRRLGYRRPAVSWVELDLLPLPPDRQRDLLGKWLQKPLADAVAGRIAEASPLLREDAANPFFLTLLAVRARQRGVEGVAGRRRELLWATVDWLVRGGGHQGKRKIGGLTSDALRGALASLCLAILQGGADAWTGAALRGLAAGIPAFADASLEDVAHDSGLFYALDAEGTRWACWHRSLVELLASEALPPDPDAAFALLGSATDLNLGRWSEVLAFYAGRLKADVVGFFRRLGAWSPMLAVRAMAVAEDLPVGAIAEALSLRGEAAAGPIRQVILRVADHPEERGETAAVLLRMADATEDVVVLQLVGSALLAIGAARELDPVRRKAGGAVALGIPERPWAQIPAGSFFMGSPETEQEQDSDEGPQHRVEVLHGFGMLATPVTQALYLVVMGTNPSLFEGDLRRPVESVTWDDAVAFCAALSRLLGAKVRLPREEEWEYACRAGTPTRFWSGDGEADLARVGWYYRNSGQKTHPVGQKPASPWGLYDLHGNVWEWTSSPWTRDYENAPAVADPLADPAAVGADRVVRGGGWVYDPGGCRSAYRSRWDPWLRNRLLGFRVLLPARPSPAIDP